MKSRARYRRDGLRTNATNRSISAAYAAAEPAAVSRFGCAVQGIFGTDRIGEESGAVPGGDSAVVSKSGPGGIAGRADLPNATGFDAGVADRDSRREPYSV